MNLRTLWGRAVGAGNRIVVRFAPKRYHLTVTFYMHLLQGCEQELRYLHRIGPNRGIALDIGANEGLFAYQMAKTYRQVIAFEPNPALTAALKAYRSDKIRIIQKAVSSVHGSAELRVPILRGTEYTGWATLVPDLYPHVTEFRIIQVEKCTVDDLELVDVGLIKIDVEGHELDVLTGAYETIRKNRPHVIAEIKPQFYAEARSYFDRLKYRSCRLNDLIGVAPSGANMIFIP